MEIYEKFHGSTIDEWEEALKNALENETVLGVKFPRYTHSSILGSANAEDSISEAMRFYREAHRAAFLEGVKINKDFKILDFGCGATCRLGRSFLREIPARNIYGVDVQPEYVDICKKDIPGREFPTYKHKASPAFRE